MVYNAMYPVGQRPTFINYRSKINKKEDEESSKSSNAQTEAEEQPQVLKHEGNDEFTKTISGEKSTATNASNVVTTPINPSFNYKNVNPEVNIAQILKDYKNTALAIGTPPELEETVDSYLELVKTEVQKEVPNTKLVKSNLKNAAILLDGYITETLQRPSNVVENWADALFLQQINYNYNEKDINEQFLVKFPNRNKQNSEGTTAVQTQNTSNTNASNTTEKISSQLPEDSQLENLFVKAKTAKNSQNALYTFTQALKRADEVKDSETKAKIYFEIGQIYDKDNNLKLALENYNQASTIATDANVKTKAFYSMAQIYDDVANLNPAINNYLNSVSYAGEAENFKSQSKSLTKIGNILTDKYDKSAFNFYGEASDIADLSDNHKLKGYIASNTADAYVQFQQPKEALKNYSSAVKNYSEGKSDKKVAQNYQKAATLMADYGNSAKAKSLLLKAKNAAINSNDENLLAEINSQIAEFND